MLELKNLSKSYGGLTAVKDLSFSLNPGDVFGFIGSNGAGKTTTIRMLATLLEPTSGTATLNGADIIGDPMAVRAMLGYMPDFFGLYDDVKVWEYLDFFATIYRIAPKQRQAVISSVLELTNLTGKRDAFIQSLSRGMQQRLCLARCLVHDPALLLLDEPASGLDPRARAELKELILELGRMGKIVIVSSHILPELSDFCNTVGILEAGDLLAFGPVSEIVQQIRPQRVLRIELLDRASDALSLLESHSPVSAASLVDGKPEVRVEFSGDLEAQVELLAMMVKNGLPVVSLQEEETNLEDVFMKLTTGAVN
ncbi:MAG: ABC transporter ATP-binding protein [Armatimonadetes bacterium]|nr:ABC transporter ATP-binding protein [Armatimonadota bacterium]